MLMDINAPLQSLLATMKHLVDINQKCVTGELTVDKGRLLLAEIENEVGMITDWVQEATKLLV